jgi:hypothetical protein
MAPGAAGLRPQPDYRGTDVLERAGRFVDCSF